MRKTLLTCGDSWTFGSEIIHPDFLAEKQIPYYAPVYKDQNILDYSPENDEYRIPRIWPSFLGNKLGCDVVNISKPAVGNDWIYNTTITWILDNYISQGKSTEDLIVVIGWSSIARKELLLNINNEIVESTPSNELFSYNKLSELDEFFKWYALVVINDYESIFRYINNNFDLSNFCKLHKIEFYAFNALAEEYNSFASNKFYKDLKVVNYLEGFKKIRGFWARNFYKEAMLKWMPLNERNIILKDKTLNSFANFIFQLPVSDRLLGNHPSEMSHKIWADFLYDWIVNKEDTFMKSITNNYVKNK